MLTDIFGRYPALCLLQVCILVAGMASLLRVGHGWVGGRVGISGGLKRTMIDLSRMNVKTCSRKF